MITEEEMAQISRRDLLNFFWKNGTTQVIVVIAGKNDVVGTIIYPYVQQYQEEDKYIIKRTFVITENFWGEAKLFLKRNHGRWYLFMDWGVS